MSTSEDLDDTSSNKEIEEEANFCFMADTTWKESKSDSIKEVNLDDPKILTLAYHELLCNSSILSKAYKNLRKDFKNLSKDNIELKKAHQDISLLTKPN